MAASRKTPNQTDVEIGARVRALRMAAGMSQEKLGDACGITFQQIQKYEKGVNRVSASPLYRIAKLLGKPIEWFFMDLPHQPRKSETKNART